MFSEVKNQVNFPELERDVAKFWEKENVFQKSINFSSKKKSFVFYDGPPFATGLPHYGHLLASTIKDIIPRYFSMQGYRVERRFGWDCHGLPVEMEIQKNLGLKSNEDIEAYGVDKFNQECKNIVLRYSSEWKKTINKLGRWVDFDNDYKTMNKEFMESVWWVFKTLYDRGLIYKGFKVLPYSWKAGTILSNFEANLNYKQTDDPSLIVKFPSQERKEEFFLAWTTTPWTLISNLALAVNQQLTYLKIKNKINAEVYFLSERSYKHLKDKDNFTVLKKLMGKDLVGQKYKPLFPYAEKIIKVDQYPNCFTIHHADFVGEEEGVGIVHIAPAYGEEDYALGQKVKLTHFDAVNQEGEFILEIDFIAGENIKTADKKIIKKLKEKNLVFEHKTFKHNYPFCWRTDTPLMYKAISTWFVKVEAFKKELIANNQKINWLPKHIKDGRFGKWLENVKDWAISRNRYWGTPLPIWESAQGDYLCYGDIASLSQDTGKEITDLHKEYIDDLIINKNGKEYRRVKQVLDCWFESGSMPYAHNHYPFENKKKFEKKFPADFISEGIDQTRGWFYTLLVIATGLFDKPSFKNVIVSGLILAEDGKKMSKRLKNYPDPNFILDHYGADALRVYLISSNVIKAETLRFSEKGLKEIVKNILIPLWNSLSFLTTYANMDKWKYSSYSIQELKNPLDQWLFSYKETLIKNVTRAMKNYEIFQAVPPLIDFIDKLTNVYIRRSRKRYWKSEKDDDKSQAYFTLYTILKDFSIILAPFMPFISEKIYQILRNPSELISVHLNNYLIFNQKNINQELEREIQLVGKIISLSRALRLQHKIKIRQPLSVLTVFTKEKNIQAVIEKYELMIKEELNVKTVVASSEEENYLNYSAKINFKNYGKKLGKEISLINKKIVAMKSEEIKTILETSQVTLNLNQREIKLPISALVITRVGKKGYQVISNEGITCVLETTLNEDLILEGLAREIVNRIQKKRKELDLKYNQKIFIEYKGTEKIQNAIKKNYNYVSYETLCEQLIFAEQQINNEQSINQENFAFDLKLAEN